VSASPTLTLYNYARCRDNRYARPNGYRYTEFSYQRDPALVPQAVASLLGVREGPERPLLDGLFAYLESRVPTPRT
jgi:hypothetical protein